ncbi:MAG: hypothetical protein D6795_08055 [Deltaproteobacteria bacterium]|nr:MAG: hypothetical protein D6795_08055 [Deltaproteobacteria bacterium]
MKAPHRLLLPLLLPLLLFGCGQTPALDCTKVGGEPCSPSQLWPVSPDTNEVEDPIAFTTEPYGFPAEGEAGLSFLAGKYPISRENAWVLLSRDETFPVEDCDPNRSGNQRPQPDPDLPFTVEGIVTLHPRYFLKVRVCNEDERYYGSFFIEDDSGGMVVLQDSRIAELDFGDRVRIRARALLDYFDVHAILIPEIVEVIEHGVPIHYEEKTNPFNQTDWNRVRRIRGEVVQASTDHNFNEAAVSDGQNTWLVSIDRELANRNVSLEVGDRVEVTGPVLSSFGQKIVVLSVGQIRYLP